MDDRLQAAHIPPSEAQAAGVDAHPVRKPPSTPRQHSRRRTDHSCSGLNTLTRRQARFSVLAGGVACFFVTLGLIGLLAAVVLLAGTVVLAGISDTLTDHESNPGQNAFAALADSTALPLLAMAGGALLLLVVGYASSMALLRRGSLGRRTSITWCGLAAASIPIPVVSLLLTFAIAAVDDNLLPSHYTGSAHDAQVAALVVTVSSLAGAAIGGFLWWPLAAAFNRRS